MDFHSAYQLAMNGQEEGFRFLYDNSAQSVYEYLFQSLRDKEKADQMLARVYDRAWAELGLLNNPETFPGWVYSIAEEMVRQEFQKMRGPSVSAEYDPNAVSGGNAAGGEPGMIPDTAHASPNASHVSSANAVQGVSPNIAGVRGESVGAKSLAAGAKAASTGATGAKTAFLSTVAGKVILGVGIAAAATSLVVGSYYIAKKINSKKEPKEAESTEISSAVIENTDEKLTEAVTEAITEAVSTEAATEEVTSEEEKTASALFSTPEEAMDDFMDHIQTRDFAAILKNLSDEEALALIERKNEIAPGLPFQTPEELREWAVSVDPGPDGYYSGQGCFYSWNMGTDGKLTDWKMEKAEPLTEEEKKEIQAYIDDTKVDEIQAFTLTYTVEMSGVQSQYEKAKGASDTRILCCRRGDTWTIRQPYDSISYMIHDSEYCWTSRYLDYLYRNGYSQNDFSYALVYIDDDDVPELFIDIGLMDAWEILYFDPEGKSENTDHSVGKLSESNGVGSYIERRGLVHASEASAGYFKDSIYSFQNNEFTCLSFGDGYMKPDETGQGYQTDYNWEGKPVSEDEYHASIQSYFDSAKGERLKGEQSYYEMEDILENK